MPFAADWLYRHLRQRYLIAYLVFEVVSAMIIAVATVGLLSLYQDMSKAEFDRIVGFSWLCIFLSLAVSAHKLRHFSEPLVRWIRGERTRGLAVEAWTTAMRLPREFVTTGMLQAIVLLVLAIPAYIVAELELPLYSFVIIMAGTLVAAAYAAILHFFAAELALAPVVREMAEDLPEDFRGIESTIPLRWKLLGALPLVNVITGVVVSGLSTDGKASLHDLGVDVVVAVIVAFTVSLELTILVTRTVVTPVRELLDATERVKRGDLSTRAPISSADELGDLARSFNEMMDGLEERERLREAFGSYVDPDVADRVLSEGVQLEGEDVEVTVLFVDIRDFTPFAERSSARETVALLNEFFGLVVPILAKHGGHANKFIGDGVLGVFGAPERLRDHADRAVAAGIEIVDAMERRWGGDLHVGVGINSGPVSAGTIGGGGRLEFTVVGDTVNVAARAERLTRELGDDVLLTEATRCLLSDPDGAVEQRGEIEVKGKSQRILMYAPSEVLAERAAQPAEGAAPEPAERAAG